MSESIPSKIISSLLYWRCFFLVHVQLKMEINEKFWIRKNPRKKLMAYCGIVFKFWPNQCASALSVYSVQLYLLYTLYNLFHNCFLKDDLILRISMLNFFFSVYFSSFPSKSEWFIVDKMNKSKCILVCSVKLKTLFTGAAFISSVAAGYQKFSRFAVVVFFAVCVARFSVVKYFSYCFFLRSLAVCC